MFVLLNKYSIFQFSHIEINGDVHVQVDHLESLESLTIARRTFSRLDSIIPQRHAYPSILKSILGVKHISSIISKN